VDLSPRANAAKHNRRRIERVDQDTVAAEAGVAEIERIDALVIAGSAVEHIAHMGRRCSVNHGDRGRAPIQPRTRSASTAECARARPGCGS